MYGVSCLTTAKNTQNEAWLGKQIRKEQENEVAN
jgi:hypothetical protein